MLRKLLLATSTLAVILVLFLVYHLSTGGARETEVEPVEVTLAQVELQLPEVSDSPPVQELPRIKDVPIGQGGKKAWVTWYDKKTRKAKTQFRATTWEPLSNTEFHLVDLEVRMIMPGGQIAEVQADEGEILVSPGDLSESSIRRGWVQGHVQIRIDRTSPEWREQHPDRRDMAQHPEKIVRLWMDRLHFDLELSRLETQSTFRVQSAEADLQGNGLLLCWNEDEDRIDYLEIAQGQQLKLRGLKSKLDFTLLSSEAEVIEDEVAMPSGPDAEAAPAPEEPDQEDRLVHAKAQEEDPDVLRLDLQGREKPRQRVAYRARFLGNVVADQRRGLELLGRLEADALALLFDAGQVEEVAAVPESDSPEKPETEPAAPPTDETRLVLTWDGPLIVEPQAEPPGPLEDDRQLRRFQVEATGSPVRLSDQQGSATCDQLVYHNETGRLWLRGRPEAPVNIKAGPERTMRAETLFYDRHENIARLTGQGEMKASTTRLGTRRQPDPESARDRHPAEQTVIRWTRSVELEMARSEFKLRDPHSGKIKTVKSPWVKGAVLDGSVLLAQQDQQAQAERMQIAFAPPQKPGRLLSDVHRFEGWGRVQLTRGQDDIRCDHMIIDMTTAPDGRNVPTRALAEGDASAKQRHRIIRARHSMTVTMGEIPRPQKEVSLKEAKRLARARGLDPDKVDWDEWARRRAARTETAIVSLDARGQVRVDDEQRRLRVRAEQLQCTFPDGRQIERADIMAAPGRLAEVHLEDFAIAGHHIELDASEPWALVPGPGELEFYSDQDLDGKKLERPLPVIVSWEGKMEMRGGANQLHFEQNVQATSTDQGREHYHLNCDRLSLTFIDLPSPRTVQQPTQQASPYWILEPLLRRWTGKQPKGSSLFGDGAPRRSFRKKPVLLLADGRAKALYSEYTPTSNALQSRMRVAGPRIAVDLRRQTTNVEGAGNLLIEDYRLPGPGQRRERGARPAADSLLGQWAGGGPSQTLFTWENSMSFLTRRNLAIFDQNIQMTHRAGAEMKLVGRVAAARHLDLTQLQDMKGRKTSLDCASLLVEFAREARDSTERRRSVDLRFLEATGPVTLRDGGKTLVGHRLVYLGDSGLVTVRGQAGQDAHIYDEDRASGALRAHWRGPVLRWNLNNNHIEASQSTILLGGR